MDQLNPDAHNNPNQTQPKIGHGGERPDFELGKLDPREEARLLNELHSREAVPDALVGRTQIEDAADTLARTNSPIITDTLPTTEIAEKPEKKKKGLLISLGGAAAGLAVAATAFFATQANNGDTNNTPPEKNPDDTTQVEPGTDGEEKPPVETEKTFEQLVDETKIEAGLSAKEYAETFQDRLNKWALAGATTDEDYESWFEAGGTIDYEDNIAASQTAIYTNALFGPGYQNEPNLVNAEANFTDRNAVWLGRWMRSYDYENDKGTLEIGTVVEQAEVISENPDTNERVIYIAGYDTNNAADAKFNNEDTRQKVLDANGQSWDHTLTLKTIDGVEYITKWED